MSSLAGVVAAGAIEVAGEELRWLGKRKLLDMNNGSACCGLWLVKRKWGMKELDGNACDVLAVMACGWRKRFLMCKARRG
ncbi:hypothetical protein NC651_013647 [Populus alba x Populus x berolinensis]|nr:hypothetical protein NC651_013647 [Populus alba x Populus x berolinensis]